MLRKFLDEQQRAPVLARPCASSFVLVLLVGCKEEGEPTLDIFPPSSITRGVETRVRVAATDGQGLIGKGTVKLQSDLGSLVDGVELTLDEYGSATTPFTCDSAVDRGCADTRVTFTGSWVSGKKFVTATAAAALGGSSTGSPDGGGTGSSWSGITNGLAVTGNPKAWVFPASVRVGADATYRVGFPYSVGAGQGQTIPSLIRVQVDKGADSYNLDFATPVGTDFGLGTWENAERAVFRTAGHPGIALSAYSRGCNVESGSFVVHDFALDNDGGIQSLTITFTDECEADPMQRVTGWVRIGH